MRIDSSVLVNILRIIASPYNYRLHCSLVIQLYPEKEVAVSQLLHSYILHQNKQPPTIGLSVIVSNVRRL